MVNLGAQARVAVGQHVGDVDVGSLTETRVVVQDNNSTDLAGIERRGCFGLTILEQVRVEGILGHTVDLGRTAGVVDGTMSQRTVYIVLVQDHLGVTSQVK